MFVRVTHLFDQISFPGPTLRPALSLQESLRIEDDAMFDSHRRLHRRYRMPAVYEVWSDGARLTGG